MRVNKRILKFSNTAILILMERVRELVGSIKAIASSLELIKVLIDELKEINHRIETLQDTNNKERPSSMHINDTPERLI